MSIIFSILIGTKNRPEALRRCLDSVFRQESIEQAEIIVLDDGSDRDLSQAIEPYKDLPHFKLLRNEASAGVAKGRNQLMAAAQGEFMIIVDDDGYFDHFNILKTVLDQFRQYSNLAVLASKIEDIKDGKKTIKAPFGKASKLLNQDLLQKETEVTYYGGGLHAIRSNIFKQISMYDPRLVYGEEELELSYRIIAAGYTIRYNPEFVLIHVPEPTQITSKTQHNMENFYHVGNRLLLAYRYLPFPYCLSYALVWMIRMFWRCLKEGQISLYFKGLIRGAKLIAQSKREPIGQESLDFLRSRGGRLWY